MQRTVCGRVELQHVPLYHIQKNTIYTMLVLPKVLAQEIYSPKWNNESQFVGNQWMDACKWIQHSNDWNTLFIHLFLKNEKKWSEVRIHANFHSCNGNLYIKRNENITESPWILLFNKILANKRAIKLQNWYNVVKYD